MRERLIKLIINSVSGCARNWAEKIADYLLANGVIVPPCKVGDKVYVLSNGTIIKTEVIKVKYEEEAENHGKFIRERIYAVVGNVLQEFNFSDIGKTVYLSEEAEQALVNYESSKSDNKRKENE